MDEKKEMLQEEKTALEGMDVTQEEETQDFELPKARIAYVMAIVAVLCGGNGIGILLAGLYWKGGGSLPGAVGIVVGMTAAALVVIAIIVAVHKRNVKKKLDE